jgi:CDP-4-dehydro-6-deoxyglucose reductase, E1
VSAYFGKKFGIFCNSGSSANVLSLHMAGLKPNDEVITPVCTFSTVVAPLCQLKLIPVFCDVQLRTFVPSVSQIMEKVSKKTKAIFIPNLAGSKPDWAGLKQACIQIGRSDIVLIEDSCDTMTLTNDSDISVTSFYASHVITAGGGGGMVMCNDQELLKLGLTYRDWGRIGHNTEDLNERFGYEVDGIDYDYKFLYGVKGYNFKATEMQAAFGLVQMKKLEIFLRKRRSLIDRYKENLEGLTDFILPLDDGSINWLAMPILLPDNWTRKRLMVFLEANGIQTRVFFAGNITRHPAYREYYDESIEFPNSDQIMKNCIMVGAHHGLEVEDIDYVCDVLKSYFEHSEA